MADDSTIDPGLVATIKRTTAAVQELSKTLDEVQAQSFAKELQGAFNGLDLSGFKRQVEDATHGADLRGFAREVREAFSAGDIEGGLDAFNAAVAKHDIPGYLASVQQSVHALDLPGVIDRISTAYAGFDAPKVLGSVQGVFDSLGLENLGQGVTGYAQDAWNLIGKTVSFAQRYDDQAVATVDKIAAIGQQLGQFAGMTAAATSEVAAAANQAADGGTGTSPAPEQGPRALRSGPVPAELSAPAAASSATDGAAEETGLKARFDRTRAAVAELQETINRVDVRGLISQVQGAVDGLDLSAVGERLKSATEGADLPGFAEEVKAAFSADDFAGFVAGLEGALAKHDIPGYFATIKDSIAGLDLPGFFATVQQAYSGFDVGSLLGSVRKVFDAAGLSGLGETVANLGQSAWNGIGQIIGFAQEGSAQLLKTVDLVGQAGEFLKPFAQQAGAPAGGAAMPDAAGMAAPLLSDPAMGAVSDALDPMATLAANTPVEAADPSSDPELIAQQQRFDLKLAQQAEFEAQSAAISADGQMNQEGLANDSASRQLSFDQSTQQQKLAFAGQTFGAMASMMNSKNREMFEVGKASAMAQAIVQTYSGAAMAMGQLGAWGFPVAAAIIAAGMANVANISKTSFNGGGGGGSAGGVSAPAAAATAPSSNTGGPGGGGGGGGRRITVNLSGSRFSREDVVDLIQQINEAGGDGGDSVTAG